MPQPGSLTVLSYPAAINVSTHAHDHLTKLISAHRDQLRSRGRRLAPAEQALLVLAHLRNGDTYAQLAAGFGIGVSTAWRYCREAITLLATAAETLAAAMRRIRQLSFAILDRKS